MFVHNSQNYGFKIWYVQTYIIFFKVAMAHFIPFQNIVIYNNRVRREITGVCLDVADAGILRGFPMQRFYVDSVLITENKENLKI
jgi:hypothetical protein